MKFKIALLALLVSDTSFAAISEDEAYRQVEARNTAEEIATAQEISKSYDKFDGGYQIICPTTGAQDYLLLTRNQYTAVDINGVTAFKGNIGSITEANDKWKLNIPSTKASEVTIQMNGETCHLERAKEYGRHERRLEVLEVAMDTQRLRDNFINKMNDGQSNSPDNHYGFQLTCVNAPENTKFTVFYNKLTDKAFLKKDVYEVFTEKSKFSNDGQVAYGKGNYYTNKVKSKVQDKSYQVELPLLTKNNHVSQWGNENMEIPFHEGTFESDLNLGRNSIVLRVSGDDKYNCYGNHEITDLIKAEELLKQTELEVLK